MMLRAAVFTSIILSCAGAFLAGQFLEPLPLPAVIVPGLVQLDLGQIATAAIAGLTIYAALCTLLVTSALIAALISAQRHLEANAITEGREYLAASEWHAAFSSPIIEPLASQMVTCLPLHDDRLLLSAPFSAQAARTEARIYHTRLLAVFQIWTVVLGLIVLTFLAVVPNLLADTGHSLLHLVLAADGIVLLTLALSRIAVAIAIESLLSAISRLPLLEASTLLGESLSSVARLPAEAGLAVHRELETLSRRAESVPRAINVDRELMERLAETVASAIATSFDKRISSSLRTAEKLISTTRTVTQELMAKFTLLPVELNEQAGTERDELKRMLEFALSRLHAVLEQELEGSRRILAEVSAQHLAEIERVVSESRNGAERLTEAVVSACSTIDQERRGSLSQVARLVEIVETYTARLLPAMRRLETNEDRLSKSIGQQDETLGRLVLVVNELSGTLEVLQTALGHARARGPVETTGSEPRMYGPEADTVMAGSTPPSITRDLQSLLDDMDEKSDLP